jgi:hypothetical protein
VKNRGVKNKGVKKTMKTNKALKQGSFGIAAVLLGGTVHAASLFEQDFSSSTNVADYASATPSQNQFTDLPSTGSLGTASIENGAYKFVKTATGNPAVGRTIDMVGAPVAALKLSFDLSISGFTAPAATRLITGTVSSSSGNFMAFGVDSNGDGKWRFAHNAALTFSGTQTVAFFLNDSGETITYTAPDGSSETLINGAADTWTGTVKVKDDYTPGVNTTNNLARFNINLQNTVAGQTTTFVLDNIKASLPLKKTMKLVVLTSP